jgi:hypothetical protein
VNRLSKILAVAVALSLPASSVAWAGRGQTTFAAGGTCTPVSLLFDFDVYRFGRLIRQAPVWRLGDAPAFLFTSGMTIDADGAPNAYNADDTALDYLFNAGQPGQWDGIVQDDDGNPVVQGPDDPFPGYYISCTALFDRTKHRRDTARFVDSTQIPYVALPGDLAARMAARLGDFVFVFDPTTGRYSYAIFADIGGFGEGSIALADRLRIRSDARRGGKSGGISYIVFPGSGDGQPKAVDEIDRLAARLVEARGGADGLISCAEAAAEKPDATPDGSRQVPSDSGSVSEGR